MVDAAGFESVAQCPRELHQMMAAGKCGWPVEDTNEIFYIDTKKACSAVKVHVESGARVWGKEDTMKLKEKKV
jgi:hypothetical protein